MVGERGFEPPTPWSRTRALANWPILWNQWLGRPMESSCLLSPVVSATSWRLCQLQNRHYASHAPQAAGPSFLGPNRIPKWTDLRGQVTVIYWTNDGQDPTIPYGGVRCTGPILVQGGWTIKAIANRAELREGRSGLSILYFRVRR
jgi:hypothetical protein